MPNMIKCVSSLLTKLSCQRQILTRFHIKHNSMTLFLAKLKIEKKILSTQVFGANQIICRIRAGSYDSGENPQGT